MKRFFCTTCKRVKRVRRLPMLSKDAYTYGEDGHGAATLQPSPRNREGVCDYHTKFNVSTRKLRNRVKR